MISLPIADYAFSEKLNYFSVRHLHNFHFYCLSIFKTLEIKYTNKLLNILSAKIVRIFLTYFVRVKTNNNQSTLEMLYSYVLFV